MKIEVGKKYRSRSGVIYKVTGYNGVVYLHGSMPMWYEGGHALKNNAPHSDDLVEEVFEPETKKEPKMEFMTDYGVQTIGEVGPLKIGDRVKFTDGSYACYATKAGFKSDHPAMPGRVETGVIVAMNCKLPALYAYNQKPEDPPNDTIVVTDSNKTYFVRLAFLKRV